MYQLSQDLINNLRDANITYCHWKSNLLLNEALRGYDDLDLLVKKEDIALFEAMILQMGFKEGSNKHISFSSIKHFYGYDEETGNILHLHVYYQIKTGPSWTKSIRFDFEAYFLENLMIHESGMPIPQKHIELPMFIFRVMLKYSKINEFILVNKEHGRTLKEIDYLLNGLDEAKLEAFLAIYFSNISKKDIFEYIKTIQTGGAFKKFQKGNELRTKVSNYKYLGVCEENINNITQLGYRVLNKLFFKQKKRLHSTGMFIVVAGLDATGKTTITTELKKWLGKNLTTSLVHFGKPPSTLLTYPINLAIKLVRKNSEESPLKSSIQKEDGAKSLLYIIRQVVLAHDRYALAKKNWNKVCLGEIVFCDRYKSEEYGVMDSKRLNPEHYNGFKKKLALCENRLYDQMPQPDVLFYLTVPVEVAVVRNAERIKEGKESEAFIRVRHEQNKNLTYKATYNYKIDTDQPYETEIADIKAKIWSVL